MAKKKSSNLMSYETESSKEAFNLCYHIAYLNYTLFDNYFIHRIGSPYDTSPLLKQDKEKKIEQIRNKFNNIYKDYILDNRWEDRRRIQTNKLKILGLLLLENLSLENENEYLQIIQNNSDNFIELVKIVNKLYTQYRNQKTMIYNSNGYINGFFVLALQSILSYFRKDFSQIYKEVTKKKRGLWGVVSEKNFFDNFLNSNISQKNYVEKVVANTKPEELSSMIEIFVDQTRKKIDINHTNTINKLVSQGKETKQSTKDIYEYEKAILNYLYDNRNNLPLDIIENTIKHEGEIILNRGKLQIGQAVGFGNEDIIQMLLEDLLPSNQIDMVVKTTGSKTKVYGYYDTQNKYKTHSATITTDIEMDINLSKFQSFLSGKNKEIIKDIKQETKEKNTKIKISAKNYNPNPKKKRDISVRSNSNLSIYSAMLASQLKDSSVYDILANDNFLKYLLLNESVKERQGAFREELSQILSQVGLILMTDLNTDDEIDFMMIDQNLIPTVLIKDAYINFLKENNNKLNSYFVMSLKSETKPTVKENDMTKVKNTKALYSRNFLEANSGIGMKQYENFRFDTHINFNEVFKIIKNYILTQID